MGMSTRTREVVGSKLREALTPRAHPETVLLLKEDGDSRKKAEGLRPLAAAVGNQGQRVLVVRKAVAAAVVGSTVAGN